MRVSRVIDSGNSLGEAAQMFAETRDVDALRALLDEVPSWTLATLPTNERPKWRDVVDATCS